MHEVDRAVGLEQVPPGPLARIGLAGDEQHPQPVAHAVDRDDGGVVALGQLALDLGRGDLQHVDPAALQRHRQRHAAVDRHVEAQRLGAVERDRERREAAAPGAAPRSSTRSTRLTGSSTMAKAGAVSTTTRRSQSSALPVRSTCTGPGKLVERVGVVHLAVGDQDRAGDAVGRQLGRRLGERGQELGAVLAAVGDMHGVHLEAAALPEPVEPGLEPGQRLGELGVAAVDAVARRCRRARRSRCSAPAPGPRAGATARRARRAAPAPRARAATSRSARARAPAAIATSVSAASAAISGSGRMRGRRRSTACYWPSRSSSAGTCTWSDL